MLFINIIHELTCSKVDWLKLYSSIDISFLPGQITNISRTISKTLVGLSQKNDLGKSIKSEKNKTSLGEIENVGKNVYSEKENKNLFLINYSKLWKIFILL